jgi:hypothetical protein
MHEDGFSPWISWLQRADLAGLASPGVYVIAHSSERIVGLPFAWIPDIIYIGMTNAVSGLRGRLSQFDDTISHRPHWETER